MAANLSLPALLAIFAGAAGIVWVAGIWLSDSTDILASRFGIGQALGGIILLAISTNLPEIAITASAAIHHHLGVAIGNLLGGIAMQTVVLALLDFGMRGDEHPLTYRAASLLSVLEATLVIVVLAIAILGTRLSASLLFMRVTPQNAAILLAWLAGLWILKRARKHVPWQAEGKAPGSQQKAAGHSQAEKAQRGGRTGIVLLKFMVASVATLAAGVALEESGDAAAKQLGLSGVVFGATVLAAATSLPELSTGLTSVRMGDYQLAMSDIFGGNAFLPVLFLLASVLSGEAVLPHAQNTDVYLASLGAVLTSVYIFGLILRPGKRFARMGVDSWLVLLLYAAGAVGLVFVSKGR